MRHRLPFFEILIKSLAISVIVLLHCPIARERSFVFRRTFCGGYCSRVTCGGLAWRAHPARTLVPYSFRLWSWRRFACSVFWKIYADSIEKKQLRGHGPAILSKAIQRFHGRSMRARLMLSRLRAIWVANLISHRPAQVRKGCGPTCRSALFQNLQVCQARVLSKQFSHWEWS